MYLKAFLFFGIQLLIFSCSAPKLALHSNTTIDQIGICVEYDPSVPQEAQRLFDRQLYDFITKYNSESHMFQLHPCVDTEIESLRLYISDTKLINSGGQTAGIALSAIGLSLPFLLGVSAAPIYAGFYYFPKNISRVQMSLSDDISEQEDLWVKRAFFNPGFLMTMEKQLHKHSKKYRNFLANTFTELERSYKQHQKPQEKQQLLSKDANVNLTIHNRK